MDHVEGWFEDIYNEQYRKMIRLAYYILQDEDLAEDAVQSTFMTFLIKEPLNKSRKSAASSEKQGKPLSERA